MVDHFRYKNNVLHAEDISLENLAHSEAIKTPFYCYSHATFSRHFSVMDSAIRENLSENQKHLICYAVKANSNLEILRLLGHLGSGADVVSGGELYRCLKASIDPQKIVFSGVGKSAEEIQFAIENQILQINCESEPELNLINQIAGSLGKKQAVALRINPNVSANTHEKITTGTYENKFGLSIDHSLSILSRLDEFPNLYFKGITVHIGSQLLDLSPYEKTFELVRELITELRKKGHNITHVDLGGGIGIPYNNENTPLPKAYGQMFGSAFKNFEGIFIFEPGRMIAGNAGILVAKVLYVKKTEHKRFIILDAGMNDLLRPSLYDAYHDIIPVNHPTLYTSPPVLSDIVGPICETGDTFAKNILFPDVKAGELVAIRSAGAYGAVMASNYNSRPLPQEVLVQGDQMKVIRKKQSLEKMIELEL